MPGKKQKQQNGAPKRMIRPPGKSIYEKVALAAMGSRGGTVSRPELIFDEYQPLPNEEHGGNPTNSETVLKEVIAKGRNAAGLPDLPNINIPSTPLKIDFEHPYNHFVQAESGGGMSYGTHFFDAMGGEEARADQPSKLGADLSSHIQIPEPLADNDSEGRATSFLLVPKSDNQLNSTSTLPADFIASLPKPDSPAAIEQIKIAVKKYRSTLPPADEGEKRQSLGQSYHQLAQAKGFKCWDAMVAVASRQDKPATTEKFPGIEVGKLVYSDELGFRLVAKEDKNGVTLFSPADSSATVLDRQIFYEMRGDFFPFDEAWKYYADDKAISAYMDHLEQVSHTVKENFLGYLKKEKQEEPESFDGMVYAMTVSPTPASGEVYTETVLRSARKVSQAYVDLLTAEEDVLNPLESATPEDSSTVGFIDRRGKPVFLPVFTQTDGTLIVANSGGGKSFLLKALLENNAHQIIDIALAAKEEARKNTEEYNLGQGKEADRMIHGVEGLFAIHEMETPKRVELGDFLDNLSDDMLKDLVALAYSGRGDADYDRMREHVRSWNHDACVRKVIEIAQFLQKGLDRL